MNKKIAFIIFISLGLFLFFVYPFFNKSLNNQQQPINNNPTPTPVIINTRSMSVSPTIISEDEQLRLQTEADKKFSEWQKDIYKNYPWYNSLPLQEDTYFVYFDLDKKIFIAELYRDTTGDLKIEIFEKLKNLGVDTEKYTFQWIIKSQ